MVVTLGFKLSGVPNKNLCLTDLQTIILPLPDPYQTFIISFQLKKVVWWVGGGGWVGQPITDPISGSSLDFS